MLGLLLAEGHVMAMLTLPDRNAQPVLIPACCIQPCFTKLIGVASVLICQLVLLS